MAFRHPLWLAVRRNYKDMEEHAPEGCAARVEVFLHGDPAPLVPAVVESHQDHSWLLFHEYGEGERSEANPAIADDRLVFAHESAVARVEVRYVPKAARRVGFALAEAPAEDDQENVAP
jgi:hypothetical protein